jgi:hypothetical protein
MPYQHCPHRPLVLPFRHRLPSCGRASYQRAGANIELFQPKVTREEVPTRAFGIRLATAGEGMRSWGLTRKAMGSGKVVEIRGGQDIRVHNGGMDTLLSGERNGRNSANTNWRECSGVQKACQ